VRRAALALLLLLSAGACRGARPDPGVPAAPVAVAPMDLGGQRVLILPLQGSAGLHVTRERASEEIVFALRERDTRTQWIDPARLRRTLSQSPGFAPDPGSLPADRYLVHGERRIQGPLADAVRRYMALTEARLVVIPRGATLRPQEDGSVVVRLDAAVVDARTGLLVWFGEADGAPGPPESAGLLPSAAAALAARMVVPDSR
jgi:hypothetical protein